ncbi:M28 family peptidase [Pseudocitrobacter corydidari]
MSFMFILYQPWVTPLPSAPHHASPAKLEETVRYLSQTVHPRSADNMANLNAAASYIRHAFEASGASVSEQPVPIASGPYKNIIADFGPKDGPLIVIGAHYDSATGDENGQITYTPGADDNASGVAGLLELARLLQQQAPDVGVQLVAYASEEPPFFRSDEMGSVVHAASLTRPVKLMVALEMIGYYNDAPDSQRYPIAGLNWLYPTRGNFIAVVGRMQDISAVRQVKAGLLSVKKLPVYSINAPSFVPGIDFSDHLNYWQRDIPAVMITDTAFFRNTEYHLKGDTADRLDYERMAQVVDGVLILLRDIKN